MLLGDMTGPIKCANLRLINIECHVKSPRFLITTLGFNKNVSHLPNRKWNPSQKRGVEAGFPMSGFSKYISYKVFVSKLFSKSNAS